jgi:hypothetical protein
MIIKLCFSICSPCLREKIIWHTFRNYFIYILGCIRRFWVAVAINFHINDWNIIFKFLFITKHKLWRQPSEIKRKFKKKKFHPQILCFRKALPHSFVSYFHLKCIVNKWKLLEKIFSVRLSTVCVAHESNLSQNNLNGR